MIRAALVRTQRMRGKTMTETVTVRGFVATDPSLTTYDSGARVTTFRLASTARYFDRGSGAWVNGETNWFSVSCFRELAMNVQCSVKKGEPVLVSGRLRIRQFDRKDGSGVGTSVGIEAESVGHDLVLGTATYARRMFAGSKPAEDAHPDAGQEPGRDGSSQERPGHVDADGVLVDGEHQESERDAWGHQQHQGAGEDNTGEDNTDEGAGDGAQDQESAGREVSVA